MGILLRCVCLSTFFCLSGFSFYFKHLPTNPPKYPALDEEWSLISSSQPAFMFKNPDSLLNHQMHLLMDKEGLPLFYYSDIQTPVCIDGLCKPVNVELYWNLIGNYLGYGVYSDELLSKYDHEIFEEEDYLTLHNLLSDELSILGRRKLSTLYNSDVKRDKAIKFKGVEVDAISGATIKEIKTSVVGGALYSCYTLWHLVHGEAAVKIKDNIPHIYSESHEDYFLRSNHEDYHYYAIKRLSSSDFEKNIDLITLIFKNGNPLLRSYILKKLPKQLYAHPLMISDVYKQFSQLDLNSKTILLENLMHSAVASVIYLSDQLSSMSHNQIKIFLRMISKMESFEIAEVEESFRDFATNNNSPYSHLVTEFLENHEK